MFSWLASNKTHCILAMTVVILLYYVCFLNISIFVVIFYIMFSSLSVHYCARNIRRIFRAVRSGKTKCNKEDCMLPTLMKQSHMMFKNVYLYKSLSNSHLKFSFMMLITLFSRLQPDI